MTIGVVVKYKDGVILGSDSQMTLSDVPYKTQGTKIEQIGGRVALVCAGSTDFFKELSRRLGDYREDIDKQNIPETTDLVSQTMADMYTQLANRFRKNGIEEAIPFAPVSILVAGLDLSYKPHIFHVTPPGVYGPENLHGIIGSGIFYAGRVLRGRRTDLMKSWVDIGKLTTRAITEAAEMDPYVGGEINLVQIDGDLGKRTGNTFNDKYGENFLGEFQKMIKAEDAVISALVGDIGNSQRLEALSEELKIMVRDVRQQLEEVPFGKTQSA